jgi:Acetyltransferase (GNAT) domain
MSTVADLIGRSQQTFRTHDWGLWVIRPAPPAAPELLGVCGLSPSDHGPGVELLYSLAPTHWSQGLATEAVTAVLAHAFDNLGLDEVVATTDDANTPPSASSPASAPSRPPGSRSARTPTPASPSPDPGMLLEGPCSSMDRATDF